jgi:Domain of unknown function (DUF4915)
VTTTLPAGGGEDVAVRDDVELLASEGFADWLAGQDVSLVFGTPPAKLWLIGIDEQSQLAVFDRSLDKVMGLASDGKDRLWVATRFEIWRFENVLAPGSTTSDGHDRLFIPRRATPRASSPAGTRLSCPARPPATVVTSTAWP